MSTNDVSRRKLLVAAGASAGFGAAAGCLDRGPEPDGDAGDPGDPDPSSDAGDPTPLERWVPAAGSSELLFHSRDLADVRRHRSDLRPAVVEEIPTAPDGEHGDIVEPLANGDAAIESVLRFGSEGVVGNFVVSGSFDPDAIDADRESSVGNFDVLERESASVAVSSDAVVISGDDGADLEAILAAGVEGADRRVDASANFARLADRLRDGTFVWGEHEAPSDGDANGSGAAHAWTLGAETTSYSVVAVYADPDGTNEFERQMADAGDDATIETEGTVGVATRTVPTEEFAYRDLFAERGSKPQEPRASVSFDVDSTARTVTVRYIGSANADHISVRDDRGNRETVTEVGRTATLEYESGDSVTITVVAVGEETESTVATESFEF